MKQITIYGLGAIGSNLLVQLAKTFPDYKFSGVDYDKVEDRNIRTQAYFLEHVGLHKVNAMKVVLARYFKSIKYYPVNRKVESNLQPIGSDLIIDCFDNSKSRKFLSGIKGHNVLHVGFSPQYSAECIWDEDYDVPGDVDPAQADICSMTDAVPFIHFVVNAVALNISHWLETGEKKNFIVTNKNKIKWL